ncbi:Alpha/Beta hydrolase protein [Suillus ampliporus]|nr:Alpha/Beta hydrolase protein [Suillus ampliporus]
MSSSESPFQINVPEDKLTTLHAKLKLATFPDELDDAGWKYGAPLADIKRLTERWRNESFLEVRMILSLLTASSPKHPSFHVVALSLPGFLFSEAPHTQGFALHQYAKVAHKLMVALGHNEYVTQGGDWGLIHHKAWHTNFPLYIIFYRSPWSSEEKAGIERTTYTQPQTLGYSLADSPVVLTWISLYWFSRVGPAASLRIYLAIVRASPLINFVATMLTRERRWLRKLNNVVFESHHKIGGHFAATE